MLDKNKVRIGIAPIAWTEDDMPEMGAGNSFLQTMYDCGIPTAVCFLLLVILLLIRGAGAFRLAYRKEDSADMQLLSFALLVAFTVAGLSEWNFQFSNPMTITAMLAVVPLLTGKWKRRPVQ